MCSIHVLLVLIVPWCVLASDPPNYVETGECEVEQFCSYSYSAQQEYLNNGNNHFTEFNATVGITCTSSGVYNESEAKLYCMEITNANLISNSMENSTDDEILAIQQSLTNQLGNWFCFTQTSSGKIPAVYHSPSEPDHVISLKKSISAAFQANFEGTDEEEEIDPQSRHTSHYTYTPTTEEGLVKMHRSVRKEDVREISGEDSLEDIDTAQDDEIQYRSGRLERASGNTMFHPVNESDTGTNVDTVSLSHIFSATGSYNMELKSCRKIRKYLFGVQKKKILSEMKKNSQQESLKTKIDKKMEAMEEMKNLREKLPSGSALKALQNYDKIGDEIVQLLLSLIELESLYGPLQKYSPVIDDVLLFIPNMPATRKLREGVIMLLSTDASLESQMTLLNAYDNALDDAEDNVILTHISFMKTVSIEFVIGIEDRLARLSNDEFLNDQLLLVLGSLATKGSEEVERRVLSFLTAKASSLNAQSTPELKEIKILIYALGNTGSKLSIAPILSFLNKSYNYDEIKMVVIDALNKVTDDVEVLARLEDFLIEDTSIECLAAIIETLHTGHGYMKENKRVLAEYGNTMKSHTLLKSLVEAVSLINDTDLHTMLEEYLVKIDAEEEVFDLLYTFTGSLGKRGKRGTSDWDSSSNSDYNYVNSLVNRQTDVNTYPRHTAYIHSPNEIGVDEANIKIAYGYFAGTSTHCDRMKAFGRGIVVGKLFSYTSTLADMKVDVTISTTSASVIAFVRIGSNTLLDTDIQTSVDNCYPYNRDLAEFRKRLFSRRFSFFIYVGTLSLTIHLDAVFDVDVNTNACIGRTGTEVSGALGAFTPTVGVILTGGVSANILSLARGGIDLSASFNYRLEPAASVQVCTAYCTLSGRTCIGLYDSFPNNHLTLDAWYQVRNTGFCGSGWFRYPCIYWGSRQTWDALSHTWNLWGRGREVVWQHCYGDLHPTCAAGALSSPLFAQ